MHKACRWYVPWHNVGLTDLKVLLHDRVQLEEIAVHARHAALVFLSIYSHLHHALCKAAGGQGFTQLTFLQSQGTCTVGGSKDAVATCCSRMAVYAQKARLRSNLSLQNIWLHILGCVQSCRTGVRFFGGHTSDQTQATSRVWQLPPMESFRKCVSLDER